MKYIFKATEEYWQNFYALSSAQKESVREKWKVFKVDPFHPSLGTHKIHSLSSRAKQTVYSVVIEGDLRVLFLIKGGTVITLDVGTHKINS